MVNSIEFTFIDIFHNSELFFTKDEFRKNIFQKLGSDRFKSLRHIIGGRGSGNFAEIKQSRYILMWGLEPHFADSGYAAVVIDSLNGETYSAQVDIDSNFFHIATTGKWEGNNAFQILTDPFFSYDATKNDSKKIRDKKKIFKSKMEKQIGISGN
jgi:hypothetical protein